MGWIVDFQGEGGCSHGVGGYSQEVRGGLQGAGDRPPEGWIVDFQRVAGCS